METVARAGAFGGGFGGEIATPQTLAIHAVTGVPSISSSWGGPVPLTASPTSSCSARTSPAIQARCWLTAYATGAGAASATEIRSESSRPTLLAQIVDRAHDLAGGAFVAEVVVEIEVEGHRP